MCSCVSSVCPHLAHRYSSGRLYTPGYQDRCRARVGRNPMSSLYPKARVLASRLLVMFQRFLFCVLPSGRMVHCSVCRMSFTSVGVCVGRFGTALIWAVSWSDVIVSSCSRRSRRGLLGTTLPSCRIQNGASAGGGIREETRSLCGSNGCEPMGGVAIQPT